jgi:quercetin dioxygenase-like cupin family protein
MMEKPRKRAAATCGAVVIGTVVLAVGLVFAQGPGVQIIRLATGRDWNADYKIKVKEPVDVAIDMLGLQPGAEIGWHYHPGPAFVVVKSGTLTEEDEDRCQTVYPAGTAFSEEAGRIHRVLNQGSEVTEFFGVLLLPADSPPAVPVPEPTGTCDGRGHRGRVRGAGPR